MEKTVKPYSAGYFIVDAEVLPHTGDYAIVARDYFEELSRHTTYPLLRIATDHFWAKPEARVPAETIAVPSEAPELGENDPVLMAKDTTAKRLISAGEKERPNL